MARYTTIQTMISLASILGVKVVGEMKNVLIRLAANNKICQFIDIMVADIPRGYGLILN